MHAEAAPYVHPPSEAVAAFLDGGLPPRERAELAAHLDTCPECRHEIVQAARLIRPAPSARPSRGRAARRRLAWAGFGVAAAAAVLLLAPGSAPAPAPGPLDVRGPETPLLRAETPADGAVLRTPAATFAWTSAGEGTLYRFTLSDETGRVVWTTQLRGTRITLPAATAFAMQPGAVHFWRVDALLPDLHSISTGDRRVVAGAP